VRTRLHRARKALEDELRAVIAARPRAEAIGDLDARLRALGSSL
jgi:hypothetical protein